MYHRPEVLVIFLICTSGRFLFIKIFEIIFGVNIMLKLTLKDGSVREVDEKIQASEVVKSIGMGLFKSACCVKIDGKVSDLRTVLTKDCLFEVLTFDDEEGKKVFWHTASHVLAQAVKRLYPTTKLAIGPAIDNGFYYDFDAEHPFNTDELKKIEDEMKKIVKENLVLEKLELAPDEAIAKLKEMDEPYKVELCEEHADKGEPILFYKQGDFIDLCAGPHLISTGAIKAFKLVACTGAYWRGSEKNKMLSRVYGTAFPKAAQLEEELQRREEARNRDHNKLGRQLDFFTTVGFIGQGLPIMLPNGSRVLQLLQRFVEDEEQKRGYQLITMNPLMAKRDLYKISGHWDHYRDSMFVFGDPQTWDDESADVLALRPMACPFQFMAYNNKPRSFRDLPIKYDETATLFRNEDSGEMHGLIRVRQFTISEGHIMCLPSQVEQQFKECVELIEFMQKTVGLYEDLTFRFSKWDENNKNKYIGSAEDWENTQNAMRTILDHLGLEYTEADGEAAFYGPKLDVQIKNVYGKEDTLCTVQIDFQLAERYGMVYTDSDGVKKYPIIIHRTSIGCYQRVLALMLEKFGGAFPTWLAPTQVKVMSLPGCDSAEKYADQLNKSFILSGIRSVFDNRNEKIGRKIRDAQVEKVPYMIIIGEKEAENGVISVRSRKDGELGTMTVEDFLARLKNEVDNRILNV